MVKRQICVGVSPVSIASGSAALCSCFLRVRSQGSGSRYSVPFFFNGNYDFQIDPIPILGENSTLVYESITVGEHIKKRLRDTHVDVDEDKIRS